VTARAAILLAFGCLVVLFTMAGTFAQTAPRSPAVAPPRPAHQGGELDCRNCHLGKHQGVLQMYVGSGGRGTPMIPSHMFQVRVECVACHTAPKTPTPDDGAAPLLGQTFRPSEEACLACHGDRYRGMLGQWTGTLARMRESLTPTLDTARAAVKAADAKHPRFARARTLIDDAEFNARFVALAKGVHNVFYAADLLKLANGWASEALLLLGQRAPKTDDQLLRGGYCAVLCHQTAGVKQRETVTFRGRKIPHVRHVSELGATCTSCHSAETHKAVTATAATCTSCHHGPTNERCEGCHQEQSAFYRGQTKTPLAVVAPNVMADVVGCTGCHDWSRKSSRRAIAESCRGCHEARYLALLTEWTTGYRPELQATGQSIKSAEAALATARRRGAVSSDTAALVNEARDAFSLVKRAGLAHNPLAADALLSAARRHADDARAAITRR
jgi:hypothetical protein